MQVAGDSARMRRYRLLQSWYRETVLDARPGTYVPRGGEERPLGSLLHVDDVARREDLNFVSPDIGAYTRARAAEVMESGGTLEEKRLFHNMLSSMPLCFNLFGALRTTLEAQLPLVRACFDPEAVQVELIECEWIPVDPASTVGDRTAFDAAVVTRRADGSRHLVGVETKYTEPFSKTRYGARAHDAGRYRAVHDGSGWFTPQSHDGLTSSATNQLWRNCLLAAASERSGEFDSASVAVVAVSDDRHAVRAIEGVTAGMTDPARCRLVSLDSIVATASRLPELASWSAAFERRYLDLTPAG